MVTSDELSVSLFSTLNIPKHLLITCISCRFYFNDVLNYTHIENNYQRLSYVSYYRF